MAKATRPSKLNSNAEPIDSLLQQAYAQYELGNSAGARRLAQQAMNHVESPLERAAALALAPALFETSGSLETNPLTVANEIIRRTETPAGAFLFALIAVAIFVLLVILASARY